MTKLKTFVLTVSKHFMLGHPKAGQPTGFMEKILNGEKIHTIRGNATYWGNIVQQVNQGKAVLSLRQWSGRPYNSKQVEFCELTRLGFQRIWMWAEGDFNVDGKLIGYDKTLLAKNDGLELEDFNAWFKAGKDFEGAIIHFTDFKY